MKRSLKELEKYSIEAKDGMKGTVKDFLFDEEKWVIRYLLADYGYPFAKNEVLIPKLFLKEPEWRNKHFPVNLSKKDIENCPTLDEDLPVSRRYEKILYEYYEQGDYWSHDILPTAEGQTAYPYRMVNVPDTETIIEEKDIDTVLRSFNEIKGYHVQALDGELGHVVDIIIDDVDWQILYAVVDTSNWKLWSKKVLISTIWMDSISYTDEKLKINLRSEMIEAAPEYDPSTPVNSEYEKRLYDYYGRPGQQI